MSARFLSISVSGVRTQITFHTSYSASAITQESTVPVSHITIIFELQQ